MSSHYSAIPHFRELFDRPSYKTSKKYWETRRKCRMKSLTIRTFHQ